jgi:hypothetical protein
MIAIAAPPSIKTPRSCYENHSLASSVRKQLGDKPKLVLQVSGTPATERETGSSIGSAKL